ncbi:peroxiredoxin [Vulgatibacter sp.]|uniref:peroxiredoxin n=1 Tax=Vulgatibacter sp. TaxID=1971226 RepID=UPI003569D4EA
MLAVNDEAPTFRAESTKGTIDLAAYLGKKRVVLIFYPVDETPTCTKQLCAVRDAAADYESADTVVFGVNPASLEAHQRFAQRQGYDFPLLVDEGGRIRKAYGVGKLLGLGPQQRIVYGIGLDGRIVYAQKGNPPTAEILAALGRS